MSNWTIEDSKSLYGLNRWGSTFFDINAKGNVTVRTPELNYPADLKEIIDDLKERGIAAPILMRFPDILASRVNLLKSCFDNAIEAMDYKGVYKGIFPVKMNQQKHLVDDIVAVGKKSSLGLECGSKPELLIALTKLKNREALLICNGFKDIEYIETALISRKLGRNTIIVVDRSSELELIIEASKRLGIRPKIGLRAKLSTRSSGRWVESTGHKSKFGLTPHEIVDCLNRLKEVEMMDCVDLVHFHIGSQIPSILSIKASLKEGARFYTELYKLGASPRYIDVGGGLGIDYDGSGVTHHSTNYSEQEYANDVIYIIKSICNEKGVPHPNIITESGRALVAHSAILVFDVLGCNSFENVKPDSFETKPTDHQILRDLSDISASLTATTLNESYNDLKQIQDDILQLFTYGVLDLAQRAMAEKMIFSILARMKTLTSKNTDFADVQYEIDSFLCDSYFCNFSVFQSLPDSWAVDQLFPILPIVRLNEKPDRRATIADLTCDSDGKINRFIDPETNEAKNYLELHELKKDEPYYIAVFLTGAYQEILGDLHNLFGDTSAVHIHLKENGYMIDHIVLGDSVNDVLTYVEYETDEFQTQLKQECMMAIEEKAISQKQADILMDHFDRTLKGLTYLGSKSSITKDFEA
jgi:arginine decarboxylase